jgi:hypothetical protein
MEHGRFRNRLAGQARKGEPDGVERRRAAALVESPDLRPFYELMTRETFVFNNFKPTAPRPKGKLAQRLS